MTEKEFAQNWIDKLKEEFLRSFPSGFIAEDIPTKKMELPKKALVFGPELFGSYELLDSNGQKFTQVDSLYEGKFILYANRLKPAEIEIPTKEEDSKRLVKNYEKHLDKILQDIESEFNENFPESKNLHQTTNYIFNSLNLQRF